MTPSEALRLIDTNSFSLNKEASRWADLGCGDGLFTRALARTLSKGSVIHGIDKVSSLKPSINSNGVKIIPVIMDFTNDDLGLPELDGIMMANALHYVKDQLAFLHTMKKYLRAGAVFLIVEYDTDIAVAKWVPYPLSFTSLEKLFKRAGYKNIRKLGERPSVYGRGNIYSALVGE